MVCPSPWPHSIRGARTFLTASSDVVGSGISPKRKAGQRLFFRGQAASICAQQHVRWRGCYGPASSSRQERKTYGSVSRASPSTGRECDDRRASRTRLQPRSSTTYHRPLLRADNPHGQGRTDRSKRSSRPWLLLLGGRAGIHLPAVVHRGRRAPWRKGRVFCVAAETPAEIK